jgi:hypothetical protein
MASTTVRAIGLTEARNLRTMVRMTKQRKGPMERLADQILFDDALATGYVESTRNKHGYGKYMRERGMLHPSWESEIAAHEKTGFSEDQIESLNESGPDKATRQRYKKG